MDEKLLERLSNVLRYKVEIDGGNASADPKVLAEMLDWDLETVIKNAKEESVLRSGDREIKILEIRKAPKWSGKFKRYLIDIDDHETTVDIETILELADLDESDIDKIEEGAVFEHEGRKIKILEEKGIEIPGIRTTF